MVPCRLGQVSWQALLLFFSVSCLNLSGAEESLPAITGGQFGSNQTEDANFVAVDKLSGNIAVAGSTLGSLFSLNAGADDWFVSYHLPNMSLVWGLQQGSPVVDTAMGVAIDAAGDVVVVGYTLASLYGTSAGVTDYFVVKLAGVNGSVIWQRQYGGTRDDYANAVTIGENNYIFITGRTTSALYATSRGGNDIIITKLYSNDGSIVWAKQYGADFNDMGLAITLDLLGDIFVGGSTFNMFAPTVGSDDFFVGKYLSSDGTLAWGVQYYGFQRSQRRNSLHCNGF
jgi:hypothetical protein